MSSRSMIIVVLTKSGFCANLLEDYKLLYFMAYKTSFYSHPPKTKWPPKFLILYAKLKYLPKIFFFILPAEMKMAVYAVHMMHLA